MVRCATLCILGILVPHTVNAAVLINEIAWMGTAISANDEWIELYNTDTAAVSVDGFVLSGAGGLSIPLTGTIPQNGYAVLERTDDTSAPTSAFLIYTGALSNSGDTLTLRRADGSIEDQVAGGDGWESIGGDNTTKETAQRTAGGWVTASATPGSANAGAHAAAADPADNLSSSETQTIQRPPPVSYTSGIDGENTVYLVKSLTIYTPPYLYVNQPVEFDVAPAEDRDRLIRYSWNFGDGYTSDEKSPLHTYRYPGTYVVVVESYYAKHTVLARKRVTVLPTDLSLSRADNGDIRVHNNAKYETDLSGFTLAGDEEIVFPEYTILLPGATLTLARGQVEGGPWRSIRLTDPQGEVVALHDPRTALVPTARARVLPSAAVSASPQTATQPSSNKPAESAEAEPFVVPDTPLVFRPAVAEAASLGSAHEPSPYSKTAYLGLFGILFLALIGVYMKKPTA